MRKKILCAFLLMSIIIPAIYSADYSGELSTPATWSGEVYLSGDFNITNGGSLTIEPGTKVIVNGWYSINVSGTGKIKAEGTADNPIVFKPNDNTGFTSYTEDYSDTEGAWNGINFNNMDIEADSTVFIHCEFSNAKAVGGYPDCYGGIICVNASSYRPFNQLRFTSCNFNNSSGKYGGALYLSYCDAIFSKCNFYNNISRRGGAIYLNNSDIKIINCKLFNNVSSEEGGGIYLSTSDGNLINSIFSGNTASQGGGMFLHYSASNIVNCILINNKASSNGGALYNLYGATPKIFNSIIRDNIADNLANQIDIYTDSYSFVAYNCNIEGGNTFSAINFEYCIDKDPMFENSDIGDFSLQSLSPCINAGDTINISNLIPEDDFLGNPRIHQSFIDIGVVEYHEDVETVLNGILTYSDGSPVVNHEIYSGYNTDESGRFSITAGDIVQLGDTLVFLSPDDYGIYPSWTCIKNSHNIKLTAYKGIVVDTAYVVGSNIHWSADTVNVFTNIDLKDVSLVIDAGTKVKFYDWYRINVGGTGRIVANGTEDKHIIFAPSDTVGYINYINNSSSKEGSWNGVHFKNMSLDADCSIFDYCEFYNSKSVSPSYENKGGSIVVEASYSEPYNQLFLNSCIFKNNSGDQGGALFLNYSNATILNCSFINNNSGVGGVMYLENADANIINCELLNNNSSSGGALYISNSNANIINCNILNNNASSKGGAIYNHYSYQTKLYNSIIRGNIAGGDGNQIYSQALNSGRVYNSNIEGGNNFNASIFENCIDADPLFTDPSIGDYSLQLNSSCINIGDTSGISNFLPEDDLLGNNRINQSYIDIGAIECIEDINSFRGVAIYSNGSSVANQEIYSGVVTDVDGNFSIPLGENIHLGDTLQLKAPDGFSFYPSRVRLINDVGIDVKAYKGIVVDTVYAQGSNVNWFADSVNIFMDIDLTNVSLTINPGTKVKFYGWYGIKVSDQGNIIAKGTKEEPIIFMPNDTSSYTNYQEDSSGNESAWHGIFFTSMSSDADSSIFKNCMFTYSKALTSLNDACGGAICFKGSSSKQYNKLILDGCTFKNNSGNKGGALYISYSDATIVNCCFTNNNANTGGGLYLYYSNSSNINCICSNNSSNTGGGFYLYNSNNVFVNCNIIGNMASGNGGGLYNSKGNPEFFNSIIRDNLALSKGNQINHNNYLDSYIPSVYNSNIEGGNSFGASTYINCFDLDPLFTNADKGDYSLLSNSPCINVGDTTNISNFITPIDFSGNSRIFQKCIDVGALESQVNVSSVKGAVKYSNGTSVSFQEIYPGITTDENGSFEISIGGDIQFEDTLQLIAPEGYGFYPSRITVRNDAIKNITAYNGIVVDTAYQKGSKVFWESDSVHVFKDINLDNISLDISAGAVVKFYDWYRINVSNKGCIIAKGTEDNPIVFKPNSTNNYTTNNDDDLSIEGAWHGIHFQNMDAEVDSSVFSYCKFTNSKSIGVSGSNSGGVIWVEGTSENPFHQLRFSNCDFLNNSSYHGGAIYLTYSDALFSDCCFEDNSSSNYGGAIYVRGSNISFIKCQFKNNISCYGGGLNYQYCEATFVNCSFTNNNALNNGGGIYSGYSSSKIVNCNMIYNNSSYNGGAIYAERSPLELYNCIIWNNTASSMGNQIYSYSNWGSYFPEIYNSNIEGGNTFSASVYEKCIDSDPIFLNSEIEDYTLQSSSPCINAGDAIPVLDLIPQSDLMGNNRIYQHYIDMGAIEFQEDIGAIITGVARYKNGVGIKNFEILPGIISDISGNFSIQAGKNEIQIGDTLQLCAPEGYGFYPSRIAMKNTKVIELTAYKGIVVDTTYAEGSNVIWSADTVNVFMDVNLNNISLTIDKVAKVKFYDWYAINVSGNGNIRAKGTSSIPTLFTPNDTTGFTTYNTSNSITKGSWNGIHFKDMNANADSSIFTFCDFSYAKACGSDYELYGGAINVKATNDVPFNQITFSSCNFFRNSSYSGGAVFLFNSDAVFEKCNFIQNICLEKGGGMYLLYFSDPKIISCSFERNKSDYGGALALYESSNPSLVNCCIDNNISVTNAGGLFLYYSNPTVVNCNILNNKSSNIGGGIFNNQSTPHFYNCIIRGNLDKNGGNQFVNASNSFGALIKYSNVEDYESIGVSAFQYCIDSDPLFNDLENGDYTLTIGSPCIDGGNLLDITDLLPINDLQGNKRIFGDNIDIGAFEYVDVESSSNINDTESTPLINLFPNPASKYIFINGENIMGYDIYVLNVLGEIKLFSTIDTDMIKLDLRNLNQGTYIVLIKKNREIIEQRKFVKI